jgi:hypothetical protein
MYRSMKEMRGYSLVATDGSLGGLKDTLFDSRFWVVRYLVADTRAWLPGRHVLLSPSAIKEAEWASKTILLALTKKQVEDSPEIDEHLPVSRQREIEVNRYFHWPIYWEDFGPAQPAVPTEAEAEPVTEEGPDVHLRSAVEVEGYRIAATDGEIGHLEDLIVDDESWRIRYAIIDTRNWLPGRKVLVAPDWIEKISWGGREVEMGLSREQIRESPEYDPASPVNRAYEERLYDFYGRPAYWKGP